MNKPNKKPAIVSPTEAQREEQIRELERTFPKPDLEQELAKARQRKNELDCRHSQGEKLTEDEELDRDGLSVFIFNIAAYCHILTP